MSPIHEATVDFVTAEHVNCSTADQPFVILSRSQFPPVAPRPAKGQRILFADTHYGRVILGVFDAEADPDRIHTTKPAPEKPEVTIDGSSRSRWRRWLARLRSVIT